MNRDFHVVVWGATGFTGRLVARYLCQQYGISGDVRWAIGGRSQEKLQTIQSELTELDPAASNLTLITADSHDQASLKSMAAHTQVVLTTVGPYSEYGAKLVASCVEERTDYVDLCGETPFIRRMIDAHHEQAQQNQCRIVQCCGFDSIPSDIGVLALQHAAVEKLGAPLNDITFYLENAKGSMSGGTLASMMSVMDQARDPNIRRLVGNPYALNPDDGIKGSDRGDQTSVKWDDQSESWTAPFVMAGINTRVVRRSNALLDYTWGQDFKYREVMTMKDGFAGWFKAMQVTVGMGGFMLMAYPKWTRSLLQATVLPNPGQGPSPSAQENGFFRIRLRGHNDAGKMSLLVKGKRDPGYGATSRMLAESALSLALDRDQLPDRFGILTPASAMGSALIPRLATADVTFEVDES